MVVEHTRRLFATSSPRDSVVTLDLFLQQWTRYIYADVLRFSFNKLMMGTATVWFNYSISKISSFKAMIFSDLLLILRETDLMGTSRESSTNALLTAINIKWFSSSFNFINLLISACIWFQIYGYWFGKVVDFWWNLEKSTKFYTPIKFVNYKSFVNPFVPIMFETYRGSVR